VQWVIRFIVGGVVISLFAILGDVLKPKGFAGLFAAAPSVAVATLGLTVFTQGKEFASLEARSMIVGAASFVIYGVVCVYLMGVKRMRASRVALSALAIWGISAGCLWAICLR
jgi:uncharacterized membrane protein (GlpM family)